MKLLISVSWAEEQLLRVQQAFPQVEFCTARSEDEIQRVIQEIEVVFGYLNRDELMKAEKLRWIQCPSAGVEELVTIPELVNSDVILTNTSGAHAPTIAEHFFGGLISLTRSIPELIEAKKRKEWIGYRAWADRIGRQPLGLSGLTLGVIGFGNIGRAIGERAAAFQMRVIAADLLEVPRPFFLAEFWHIYQLPHLLKQSDVVVVAVPATPQTTNLLSKEMLDLMKPGSFLGVVSRGGIVDEEAVAELLNNGHLAGAVMDVFQKEPLPPESPLWDAPNLIITPHSSGKSEQTTTAATDIFIENLENYLEGIPLRNVVRKEMGF